MEPIVESLLSVNTLFDVWVTKIVTLENEIEALNNNIDVTVRLSEKLANNILSLNAGVLNSRVSNSHLPGNSKDESDEYFSYGSNTIPNGERNDKPGEAGDHRLHILEFAAHLSKGVKEVVGSFDQLSPGIKRLHSTISAINDIGESVKSFPGMFSAAKEGIGAAEEMTTGSSIITGVSATAELAGAIGGSEIIGVAAAILKIAEIIEKKLDDGINRKNEDKLKQQQKSLETFIMPEFEANSYLYHAKHLLEENQHPWTTSGNPVKENFKKYGKDAYNLNIPIPIAAQDNTYIKNNLPPGIVRSEDAMSVQHSYFEKVFGLQQRLEYAALTKGKEGFNEIALQAITDAKRYDKAHNTHNSEIVESAIFESLNNLLMDANGRKIISVARAKSSNKDENVQNKSAGNLGRAAITLNINKPLIDHFTINVKDTKEGLNDFKRKVEEVLIEILNSANAIQ